MPPPKPKRMRKISGSIERDPYVEARFDFIGKTNHNQWKEIKSNKEEIAKLKKKKAPPKRKAPAKKRKTAPKRKAPKRKTTKRKGSKRKGRKRS